MTSFEHSWQGKVHRGMRSDDRFVTETGTVREVHIVCVQWKVAPALAAGNTAILKPSEVCSVTCLELAAIAHEVGLPAGVLNVVCGYGADAGAPLR